LVLGEFDNSGMAILSGDISQRGPVARTAAAGAIAARELAPDSIRFASVLGAGVQAFWHHGE